MPEISALLFGVTDKIGIFVCFYKPYLTQTPIFRANNDKMMNRIFHVKIAGSTYLFLAVLAVAMVFAFWYMKAVIGLVVALGLIVTIERVVHSTYTLTADDRLVVYHGRFCKGKVLLLDDITEVELIQGATFGGMVSLACVRVHYAEGCVLSLTPVKPEAFVDVLMQRLERRLEE